MEPAPRRRLLAALAVGLVVVVLAARHFARGGGTSASRGWAGTSGPRRGRRGDPAREDRRPRRRRCAPARAVRPPRRGEDRGCRATRGRDDAQGRSRGGQPRRSGGGRASGRRAAARASGGSGCGRAGHRTGRSSGPVHLNTATLEQLDTLPGVGPVTAQKILDWRQTHGAFTSVDDLDAIPGIGPARLEQLRDLVAP